MNPQSKIQKGKEFEEFIAGLLRSYGIDIRARRQKGSGSGLLKGDIDNDIGWCYEAKNHKHFNWKSAAEQVKREAMGYQKEAIFWHPPFRSFDDSVTIINIHDFMELLKFIKDHQGRDEILDKWQIKDALDKAVFNLKRVIKNL